MKAGLLIFLIVMIAIGIYVLYKIFKPYFIKHDTTLLFIGGLGSGKTLETVKTAVVLLRKQRFYKWKMYNFFKVKIHNFFVMIINKKHIRYNLKLNKKYSQNKDRKKQKILKYKKIYKLREKRKKPLLYSNIPIHFRKHIFGKDREWSVELKEEHVVLLAPIREYSIVVIDELPQFINQFNWNEELIQKNVNEFITYYRHYINGFFLANAQAVDDVVVQIRRKLNQATWCFNFKKHLFGLFYTNDMCDVILSDQVQTMSTTFIEDNTKKHYGLFPKKGTYDTRCYSERMNNIYLKDFKNDRHKKLKTNKVLRLQEYTSPLDDKTTDLQKQQMLEKGERIWKK